RRQGLARAIAILEAARPAATPVIIAKNLGRRGETIDVVELQNLDQDQVDMMSLVMIGSSQTRMTPRLHGRPFVYTPRGYLDDRDNKAQTA
ncbi:MAG: precorrin-3B C(17)-methyltransferase, partial [Geminicoccaceae bacterium]